MADYRLSAKPISRSKGQSSVACAAYRSATLLIDQRTGEAHDFTRKQGVIHSEIITPANTPDWMHDRAQLWNAVESVEKRKNSQLAREVQLSLPHELNPDQRRELVRDFVREQFVNQGMIADINIHAPDKNSDERNHHAHIMLTMRELTANGFHTKKATPKARQWNHKDSLEGWREAWAKHQNHALEKHNHQSRVDHRSYEAQGIDKEPTQHRGHFASDMEIKGQPSRIGDENRAIAARNAERAIIQAQLARQQAIIARKQKLKAELKQIRERLQATGARRLLRDLFGRTKTDEQAQTALTKAIKRLPEREKQATNREAGYKSIQPTEKAPIKPIEANKTISCGKAPKDENKGRGSLTNAHNRHSKPEEQPEKEKPAWKRESYFDRKNDPDNVPAWKKKGFSRGEFTRDR